MKGHWLNSGYTKTEQPAGYSLHVVGQMDRGFWYPLKAIYRFQLNLATPLTLCLNGTFYQPDRNYDSDEGSVPVVAQRFIPKDRFILSWLLHDSGYVHGGLHVSFDMGKTYEFMAMPKPDVDEIMYQGILGDPMPGSTTEANIIWGCVRVGGRDYGRGDLKKKKG